MTSHDIAHEIEMEGKSVLLANFHNLLGAGNFCPRCLLRGESVRWWPTRQEEWQIFECSHCSYRVMDR